MGYDGVKINGYKPTWGCKPTYDVTRGPRYVLISIGIADLWDCNE